MRVLVTGATGFIGSHLASTLVREGYEVRVLVRKTSDSRWIQDLQLEWCWGDVGELDRLLEATEGVERVFHVAGVTKAVGYEAYLRANALGTRNVLEACVRQRRPPRSVVLVSSLAAWGPCSPLQPRDASDSCRPVSHYGWSKLEAERIAKTYADRIHLVVVRPTAVYGPRDRDFLQIFRLMKRGWNLIVGPGGPHLCFIHVRDLVAGILLAAEAREPSGASFFLSDGEVHTWPEVVAILERVLEVRARSIRLPIQAAWLAAVASEWVSRLRGVPPLLNRQKLREMSQEGWTCDIGGAVRTLGFSPKVSLEEGFRETHLWYRENGWI